MDRAGRRRGVPACLSTSTWKSALCRRRTRRGRPRCNRRPQFTEVLGEFIERLESVDPPEEVAEWHQTVLAYQNDLKEAFDEHPGSDELDDEFLFSVAFSLALPEHGPKLESAIDGLASDVHEQMTEAGCIDNEDFVVEDFEGDTSTSTFSPSDTQTAPTTARGSSGMTLDEYAAMCELYADDEIASDATNGEVSEELARSIELMSPIDPPPEVVDYHNETLAFGKALKRLVDLQPDNAMANPFAFLILLPQMQKLEDTMENLAPDVRRTLAAAGCAEEIESVAEGDGPSALTFAVEGPANRVTWTSVSGAMFYKVYYGDFPDCYVNNRGIPSSCRELASNVDGTTYVHADPHRDLNYYWVSACDGGCSFIYPGKYALFVDATPPAPANPRYERDGARATLTWDSSEGATHYKVYSDGFGDVRCSINRLGVTLGCDELDDNVVRTSNTHDAAGSAVTYWVVACNRGGCSAIDSGNTVEPVVQRPGSPANQSFAVRVSAIRLTWSAVDGADYYMIYYDDFFDSACSLRNDGSPSFCEELATHVVGTSYVHADPSSRENHYWVVACNRGGCSEIDSDSAARPS